MSDMCAAITADLQLLCAVCLDTWKHPVEVLNCRHIFCEQCMASLRVCPVCRGQITSTQSPSRPLINMCNAVSVECSACCWKGTREQSYTHDCETHRQAAAHIRHSGAESAESTAGGNEIGVSGDLLRYNLVGLAPVPGVEAFLANGCSNLTNIAAVSVCVTLTHVSFARCTALRDVNPLSHLAGLKVVFLDDSSVSDITFAASCPSLEEMSLSGLAELADLSPLRGMIHLRVLCAYNCPRLSNLSALSECREMKHLLVSNTRVSDLTPLRGMSQLETLCAQHCPQLNNLHALSECRAIQILHLNHTAIFDLGPLRQCRAMKDLRVFHTLVCDLSPLRGMTHLEVLLAFDCPLLKDLRALSQCCELQELNVGKTLVSDLTPLCGLPHLKKISAAFAKVTEVKGLGSCPVLTTLTLFGTPTSGYKLPGRRTTIDELLQAQN